MVELYYEPKKEVLSKITPVPNEPEMTDVESAFICGFIKSINPKRILEIGVAAGGTTAIIIQCLDLLKMNDSCELVSVDLSEKFYRDQKKETGFIAKELSDKLQNKVKHRCFFGKVLAERMEELGDNFDLVILDTVHFLPGELLDLPLILKLISPNGKIIVHDLAYHHYWNNTRDGFSNIVLFNACVGEKIVPLGTDKEKKKEMAITTDMPNIGAIGINSDTYKYIDSIFYAMTLPWVYIPDSKELDAYRKAYAKYYSNDLVNIFDIAIKLNQETQRKNSNLSFVDKAKKCAIFWLYNRPFC